MRWQTPRVSRPSSARVVGAAVTAMSVGVLPVHLTGALGPRLQADLGFGDAGLGLAIAAYFASSALLTAWGGALSDRIGAVRAMRGAVVWAMVSLLALATLTRSFWLLVALLALSTAGTAISQPGSNVLVSDGVPDTSRGLALGAKQAGVPISTFLAGLAVPAIALTLGWRWSYVAAVAVGVAALALLPDVRTSAPTRPGPDGGLRADPRRPALLLTAAGGACGAAAVAPIPTFLVRTAQEAGIGEGAAGILLAAGSLMLIGVRIGAGAAADRWSFHPFTAVAALLTTGVAGYGLFALGRPVTLVLGTVLAFGAAWGWPGLFNLGVVAGFPDAPGAASGVTQSGIFVGAVLGPLLFGVVADTAGFGAAWLLSAVWSVAAATLVLIGRNRLLAVGPSPAVS